MKSWLSRILRRVFKERSDPSRSGCAWNPQISGRYKVVNIQETSTFKVGTPTWWDRVRWRAADTWSGLQRWMWEIDTYSAYEETALGRELAANHERD